MEFIELARTFEALELTTKRLEITDILAEFFRKADAKDIDKTIYLLQGRVLPSFAGVEIGMGDKFAEQAIAKATGHTQKETTKLYQKLGDLGLAAEELSKDKKQRFLQSESLTIKHVYDAYMKMARVSGSGSQDQKINIMIELLNSAEPVEAKYLVRIPLGKLALGIGEPTILDALSVKESGDKSLREVLERAFNYTSDLGYVTKTLYEKGMKGVESIQMIVTNPVIPALAERLPSAEDIIKRLEKCAVEYKYDGMRCISGYTEIYEKDNGFMPVRDIRKGHVVLTHKGNFRKVREVNKRVIDKGERVFVFQTFLGDGFKITQGHRMLKKEGKLEKWVPVEEIKQNDWVVFPVPKFDAKEVPNKLLLRTIDNYEKKFVIDNDFYRFLGYWVGDGFSNTYNATHRVGLVLNEKDVELIDEYEHIARKNLGVDKISRNRHNGAIYLYWTDRPFLKWLSENFRNKAKKDFVGKAIPDWMAGITKNQFKSFLRGWEEADGHRTNGTMKITTKEKLLASKAQLICIKNGIPAGVKKLRIAGKTYYLLVLPSTSRKAKFEDGQFLVKVMKNHELKWNLPREVDPRLVVYNMSVEGDESYCTNTVALHNCQIHKRGKEVKIFSRKQEELTHMFPEVVKAAKEEIKQENVILDGEAIAYNEETGEYLPFQQTIQRKRKHGIDEMQKEFPIHVFVFDILFNGKNLVDEPYSERRKILEKTISGTGILKLSNMMITDRAEELQKYFDDAVAKGLEGIVAKDLNAPYTVGARKFSWIKLKRSYRSELNDTIDAVIIGYYKGKGKRTDFGLGGLLTAVYDADSDTFTSIARVGTGFSEQQLQELSELLGKVKVPKKPREVDSEVIPDVWVEPKYVVELLADEITKSPMHTTGRVKGVGYALRFPRLVNYRFDKAPQEATSVSEILSMYGQQKHTELEES